MELTSQFFEDAIEHIKTHGWRRGKEVDHRGRVCTRGALTQSRVVEECRLLFAPESIVRVDEKYTLFLCDHERMEVFQAQEDRICELMGIDILAFGGVIGWNDRPDRTQEQVIDALTRAAKTLRDQGR